MGVLYLRCCASVFPPSRLSKINGENVIGDVHDVVVAKVRAARRPMVMHFIGEYIDPPARSAPTVYGSSSSSAVPSAGAGAASKPAVIDDDLL